MFVKLLFLCSCLCAGVHCLHGTNLVQPSKSEMQAIANKIWRNECAGTVAGLTSWNQGEEFASVGIGHFIWYPLDEQGERQATTFAETFPQLLVFLHHRHVALPSWLYQPESGPAACPWKTRAAFLADMSSPKMGELRGMLNDTIALQAEFMMQRLTRALPSMLRTLPENRRPVVEERFYRVAAEPMGMYVLIDYLNFKGEGTKLSESYGGKGWGLLQVLDEMQPGSAEHATEQFAVAARQVLQRRVDNSPTERNEGRWLKGWLNRIDSYTKP